MIHDERRKGEVAVLLVLRFLGGKRCCSYCCNKKPKEIETSRAHRQSVVGFEFIFDFSFGLGLVLGFTWHVGANTNKN